MSRPVVRFRGSDLEAPSGLRQANVELYGGHLDGLRLDNVQVASYWPEIVTMERQQALLADVKADGGSFTFSKQVYTLCRCDPDWSMGAAGRIRFCQDNCPT